MLWVCVGVPDALRGGLLVSVLLCLDWVQVQLAVFEGLPDVDMLQELLASPDLLHVFDGLGEAVAREADTEWEVRVHVPRLGSLVMERVGD